MGDYKLEDALHDSLGLRGSTPRRDSVADEIAALRQRLAAVEAERDALRDDWNAIKSATRHLSDPEAPIRLHRELVALREEHEWWTRVRDNGFSLPDQEGHHKAHAAVEALRRASEPARPRPSAIDIEGHQGPR